MEIDYFRFLKNVSVRSGLSQSLLADLDCIITRASLIPKDYEKGEKKLAFDDGDNPSIKSSSFFYFILFYFMIMEGVSTLWAGLIRPGAGLIRPGEAG